MKLPEKPFDWKTFIFEKKRVLGNLQDKKLLSQVSEFNKRYLYWSEVKYRVDKSERKNIWALMKLFRSQKFEKIPLKFFNLKFTPLSEFYRKLHRFDKYLAGLIESHSKSLHLSKSYIVSSLMEEAIASSVIEGASTTRKVAKEMLRKKRKPKSKSEKMILNNYNTMQLIVDSKDKKLTPALLCLIQETIAKDTLDKEDVGKFRDCDDVVVGSGIQPDLIAHIPPKHKEIPKLVEELCRFANEKSDEFIHPVLKGIILHFLIGYIHPFNDGNGRTARSVFYWYVLSKGYWLFEYMAVSRKIVKSRTKYDLAYLFTEYDELDLTYFIKYNLGCIDLALDNMIDYIHRKQKEQEEFKKIVVGVKDLNFRQSSILEDFVKEPNKFFSIKEVKESYNVAYQTARTDLMLLAKKKYLKKVVSGKAFLFVLNERVAGKK